MQEKTESMSFAGKVVLITGASSGIGAATAIHLSQLGAFLSLHGRDVPNLKKVAEQCKDPKPHIATGEITNETVVQKILESTLQKHGKLDVLVNCAGTLEMGGIENTSLEQYDRVLNVNMRSIYHITMLAVPHLIKTQGNIVNVSGVQGTRAFPRAVSYCISKAALDQFTRCVALELAPKQVRVNAVNPGDVLTNIYRNIGINEELFKAITEHCKITHPLARPGTTAEVAKTIGFLASDHASFITGQTFLVDGGRSITCPP